MGRWSLNHLCQHDGIRQTCHSQKVVPRGVRVRVPLLVRKILCEEKTVGNNAQDLKNKSYAQIWDEWSAKYAFGAKGELSLSEARQIHRKWMKLGVLARKGLL